MELYTLLCNKFTSIIFERWKDQESLEEHFRQPYTKGAFALADTALTAPIEMLYLRDLFPVPANLVKQEHTPNTTLIVRFEVKETAVEQFIQLFEEWVHFVRTKAGNVEFHFHQVIGQQNHFVLYERWKSDAELKAHTEDLQTVEFMKELKPLLLRPIEDSLLIVVDNSRILKAH